MSIRQRVILGYLILTLPLFVLAGFGVLRLRQFAGEGRNTLQTTLDAFRECRALRSQFEEILRLRVQVIADRALEVAVENPGADRGSTSKIQPGDGSHSVAAAPGPGTASTQGGSEGGSRETPARDLPADVRTAPPTPAPGVSGRATPSIGSAEADLPPIDGPPAGGARAGGPSQALDAGAPPDQLAAPQPARIGADAAIREARSNYASLRRALEGRRYDLRENCAHIESFFGEPESARAPLAPNGSASPGADEPLEGGSFAGITDIVDAPAWSSLEAQEAARVEMSRIEDFLAGQMSHETLLLEDRIREAAERGFLAFLLAVVPPLLLGLYVIRTITRRLTALKQGTVEVARGRVGYQVPVRTGLLSRIWSSFPLPARWEFRSARARAAVQLPERTMAGLRKAARSMGVGTNEGDEVSDVLRAFNEMSTQLDKARRREADFVAVAAHEIRTPLTHIKVHADEARMVLPASAEGDEARSFLARLDEELEYLKRRVTDLRQLGVIEAGQLKLDTVEIPTRSFLLAEATPYRRLAAQKNIEYGMEISAGLPETLLADQDRLCQVVRNLLDNAFKYTSAGGRVSFRARAAERLLEIEVEDTGKGIPEESLPMIFEKYARVEGGAQSRIGGTGLGLAVARGILAAHGGTIEVQSAQGKGSLFRVRLPIRSASAAESEVA